MSDDSHARIESGLTELRTLLKDFRDLVLHDRTGRLLQDHPNPLSRFGRKCFSQTDEDGITLEILRRIGCLESGSFAEFGVGDGTENNTLILKALGWTGFWVGGEDLRFATRADDPSFAHVKDWIRLDNVIALAAQGRSAVGIDELDVVSLDLDGNDIYFVERLLQEGIRPKLFIVEYNAKFPPPVKWQIAYDPHHRWGGDDYFGASLSSFESLFERNGFRLVCCNAQSGCNAFFVRRDLDGAFGDVPTDIRDIYVPPRYHLYHAYGHKPSLRTIAQLFA
jgi:hypothetical protein